VCYSDEQWIRDGPLHVCYSDEQWIRDGLLQLSLHISCSDRKPGACMT
jgi:hypothetical protein